jgi:alginate O-acetyltransferase complex protein AlgI
VRYRELEKQIREGLWMPTTERVLKAFELIVLGLVFKVIIADTASGLVDPVFANVGASTATQIWLAWAGFTTQIYFDFMGYTHIARGVSLLFNIELPLNFDHPYNAPNISNFWQRWHITLSRWIRDYLFIPLGGSRATQLRTATNLLLTMTIAGAWHGAAWTFIIWGAYHGLLLLLYHITKAVRQSFAATIARSAIGNKSYSAICTTLTFLAVSFGWIWFRSPDCQTGVNFVGKLFRFGSLYREVSAHLGVGDFEFIITFATLILCCTLGPWLVRVTDAIRIEVPYWIKVQVATAAMVLCYIFAGAASKPFIYFQF